MIKTVRKTIQLHAAQSRFRHATEIYRGFVGGRGSGKTWAGAYDLLVRAKPGRTYMIVSPTYRVLDDTTLPTVLALARMLGMFKDYHKSSSTLTLTRGITIRFRSAEKPDKLRGPNLSGIWLDEASIMVRSVYDICIACLREGGEQGWLSATFTPRGLSHWTYEVFGTGRPNTRIVHSATGDNPFNPRDFAATLTQAYGQGAINDQEVGGKFVEEDESFQVIPATWVREAQRRWTPNGATRTLDAIGVDVARGGADRTVLARRYGHWFAPLLQHPGKATPDGPIVARHIMDALRENPSATVLIDILNCGTSVYDSVRMAGVLNAHPINFGEGVDARDWTGLIRFNNVRTFAHWSLREILDPSRGLRPALPDDLDLLRELSATKWQSLGGGIVGLEPKDAVIKRLGRSPDLADAAVLSVLTPALQAAPAYNLSA